MQLESIEILKKRRSFRYFIDKPVPNQLIEELIDCARLAPTARNVQPWEFVVVTKKETLEKIARLAENGRFIAKCPACIAVLCTDTKYYLEDGCAATENILVAASALGLGSCWVAGDKKDYCEEVKKILGVPAEFKLVSLIPLGFSDKQDTIPVKRPLNEVLHWDKF